MRTKPRIDVQREGEQGVRCCTGRAASDATRVPARMDDGQRHLLKRGQEAFGRRLGRGPRGAARVDPAKTPPSAASRRRTTNSSSVRTRKPTESSRIKPGTSSRSKYMGGNDSGCPARPPLDAVRTAVGQLPVSA